ncbi:ATPase [Candidatus Pacearchaeota archaeon CG09_land_8_20_14_0_10_30_9]|nr:MAG: ATPase [Candidatus Pacearchaeota archaeon CG11_big_fil_rev_8_21_14_0_20_30_13]PIO01221.1 MAG: ATPase [Candidatus Pacearchaeota archaeon CG09_land_8_20_14_0_10_30_9]PIZ82052.1 MAG: ATPase [Candidatus Pacearchaeota archaeon CG_4_10_14_0_2_um_filter_30_11]
MEENKDTKKEIVLKVVEALQDDAYKGIARLDLELMREIGVKRGDAILIGKNKSTIAIADRAYPADVGEGIIRIDGVLRKNAGVSIGDEVKVKKAEVKEAKKVIIAPAQKGIMVQGDPDSLRRGLLGRTVVKGDIVVLGGVQRRKDLMNEEMGDLNDIFGNLGDLLGGMGFGNLGGGVSQIKFVVVSTNPNCPVIITENTEVVLNSKAVEMIEEKIPTINYEDIGGLTEEIKKIREMVEIPLKHPEIFQKLGVSPPKGVLLHGPPGTGKTLLAKAVANESDAHFILLNGPEIMSKFYGESEKKIRTIFEEAEKNAPSIIFIDEIDAIAPKREDVQGEVERRVVSQLLTMMDGLNSRGKVIVIGASNRVNSIDQALRRPGRFDRELEIGVPDKNGRLQVLKIHSRGMPLNKDVNLEKIASLTHGFVGADIEALTKEAAMNVLRKHLPKIKLDDEEIPQDVLEKLIIKHEDFIDALRIVRPSAMREVLVETPNVGWEEVGGLDKIKNELQEAVEWPLKYADSFKRLGIRPSKGILLYGPPGTGKTLLAKAVAKESEANFIHIKGPSLLSMWVGKSEEGMRKIFERARQVAPCIIFFDELDSLAGKRGSDSNKVTERVLNQMLSEMDGLEDMKDILVIGATNRPDMLDTALLRPGRFDRILLVNAPTQEGREQIFKVHTKEMPLFLSKDEIKKMDELYKNDKVDKIISNMASGKPVSEPEIKDLDKKVNKVDFKGLSDKKKLCHYLAKETEGFTGADIEALVREAAMVALRENMESKEVKKKHFDEALKKTKPSLTKQSIEIYKKMEEQFLNSAKTAVGEKGGNYFG